ncbi:unnamed protein product [Effrenium voratum]|nr:unnamed protein product [Effrenium voratum]
MSEYLGRRPMILALQATLAVSSFTCAMAPTFTWLLLGRALQGLGASGLGVALASVHDCYEASHHKYNANGTLFSFMLLGPVVAPAVGGVLAVHGWRVSFLLVASLASMLFVVSLWAVPETAGLPSASCADTTRSLTSAHRCSLLLCMGMVKCFYDVLASGNSSVLEVNFGFSVAGAAAVSSSLAVCAAWAIALPTFLGGKPVSLMQRFLLLSCASGAFMACCGKFFSGNVEAYIFSIILALLAISPIAAECGRLFMQEVNDMAGVAGTLQYAGDFRERRSEPSCL